MNNMPEINKVRILVLNSGRNYQGEVYYRSELVIKTVLFPNEKNCIKALNKRIVDYNLLENTAIPLMKEDGIEIIYSTTKKPAKALSQAVSSSENITEETTSNEVEKQETPPEKPVITTKKQSRKPFTPYGLNGYLVDNKGNVRLMLDRRANARTIALDPTMFAALAEMVQRTQEQNNANT